MAMSAEIRFYSEPHKVTEVDAHDAGFNGWRKAQWGGCAAEKVGGGAEKPSLTLDWGSVNAMVLDSRVKYSEEGMERMGPSLSS